MLKGKNPILIQGAMDIEIDWLKVQLSNIQQHEIGEWLFWSGEINNRAVIISKTGMGMANAAAATALAIANFQPSIIINQGTAGGHDSTIHVGDIVVGKGSVNIGAFETIYRDVNSGTNALDWRPFDLFGEIIENPDPLWCNLFMSDEKWLKKFMKIAALHQHGQVVAGLIGSSDVWNRELDRIKWFNKKYHTLIEEMESAAVGQICQSLNTPFIGVRVVTNSEINHEAYQPDVAIYCQKLVYQVVQS